MSPTEIPAWGPKRSWAGPGDIAPPGMYARPHRGDLRGSSFRRPAHSAGYPALPVDPPRLWGTVRAICAYTSGSVHAGVRTCARLGVQGRRSLFDLQTIVEWVGG